MRARRDGWVAAALLATSTASAGAEPRAPEPVEMGPYVHTLAALSLGRGLRFNNPYRLATQLGKSPESLSATAPYLDLGVAAALGDPDGLQHGAMVHVSVAIQGVPQEVLTPGYLALLRLPPDWLVYGRLGTPVVLEPDLNVGGELGLGGGFLFTAGLGLTAELVGSLFYGAATYERAATAYPLLSFQLGVLVDYEVLP